MFEPSRWGDRRNVRVGILGGSFNPAHEGHVHVSREARRCLGLNEVWWLVSPQNPLKGRQDMAALENRLSSAHAIVADSWIKISALETHFGTSRTWSTIRRLRIHFPKVRFVWIMGADNLDQIPRWARWSKIFQSVHIAVFDRSPYSYSALFGKAARRFGHRRLRASHGSALWFQPNSKWIYQARHRHPASSTEIRRSQARAI